MTPEDRERVIKKVEEEFSNRNLPGLLVEDFMVHLGITTTSLILSHLIQSAKTPEEKEAMKAIPEDIINSWEKSRVQELVNPDSYAQWFSGKNATGILTEEDIREISKKFAEADGQAVAKVAARLREGFKAVKHQL